MLVQRSQAGVVMFSAQLIKHQIYHWRPRWGQTYRRRGQIMRVMGLVLPPWFCWCTGCELKGSIMFLHAWVSTSIWQRLRTTFHAFLEVSTPNHWFSGIQTEHSTDSWYPRGLLIQEYGKKCCQKAGMLLPLKEDNGKGTSWERKSPEEKSEVENSKQFYCFYPSTFFYSIICGLFLFSLCTLLFLAP